MIDLNLDKRSLTSDHFIPDVFINEVVLKTSKDPLPFGKAGRVHRGTAGDQRARNTREKLLQVEVKLSFKEIMSDNLASFWSRNSDMRKFVSVNAILITDADMFNRLFALSRSPRTKFNFQNDHILKVLNEKCQLKKVDVGNAIRSFKDQNGSNFINCRLSGKNNTLLSEIPMHVRFDPVDDLNPKNMMLIVYPYVELESVLTDSNTLARNSKSISVGRVMSKIIIKDGKVPKNGFVLKRRDNNQLYAGDYHVMPNGELMTGAVHGSRSSGRLLYKESTRDTTVKDFRQFKKYFDATISKGNAKRSIFPQSIRGSLANVSLFEKKSAAFSDIWMSYDFNGRCKFAFAINMRDIILENSRFSDFIMKNPRLATSHFDVLSMKILRKRVFLNSGNSKELSILPSRKKSNLRLDKKTQQFFNKAIGTGDEIGAKEVKNDVTTEVVSLADLNRKSVPAGTNSIRSLDLGVSGDPTVNVYSVNDASIAKIDNGHYQYGVEVKIKDNMLSYVRENIEVLEGIRIGLEQYFSVAAQPTLRVAGTQNAKRDVHVSQPGLFGVDSKVKDFKKNYNASAKSFTYDFKKLNQKIYSSVSNTPWVAAARHIVSILRNFFELEGNDYDEIFFITMCAPSTGSPEGISITIKLINKIISALQKIVGDSPMPASDEAKGPAPKNRLSGKKAGLGSGFTLKDEIVKVHYFENEIFDASAMKGVGYDFLLKAEENFKDMGEVSVARPGIRTIAASSLQQRIKQEKEKYFNSNRDEGGPGAESSAIVKQLHNFSKMDYSHLSPSRLRVNDETNISFLGAGLPCGSRSGESQYPYAEMTKAASEILSLKVFRSTNNVNIPKEEKTNFNLNNFLNDKNCTISDIKLKDSLSDMDLKREERESVFGKASKLKFSHVFKSSTAVGIGKQIKETDPLKEKWDDQLVNSRVNILGKSNNAEKLFMQLARNHVVSDVGMKLSNKAFNFSMETFDLKTDKNSLKKARLGSAQDNATDSLKEINKIPNQLKALFLSSTGDNNVINFCSFSGQQDVLKDPIKSYTYLFNFFNLMEVQYLDNFGTNERYVMTNKNVSKLSNEVVNKAPQKKILETAINKSMWKTLTREKVADAVLNKYELLCRLKKYESQLPGVDSAPGLELVTFDEYFVMRPATTQKRVTNSSNVLRKKIKTVPSKTLQKIYRDVSPEFILSTNDLIKGSSY